MPVAVLALSLTACARCEVRGRRHGRQAEAVGVQVGDCGVRVTAKAATGGSLATGRSATGRVEGGDVEVPCDVTAQKVDIGTEAEAHVLVQDGAMPKGWRSRSPM